MYARIALLFSLGGMACSPHSPRRPQPKVVCDTPTSCITGHVTYNDNSPAQSVNVTVTNLDTGLRTSSAPSDATGRFELPVAAGNYAIAITSKRGTFSAKTFALGSSAARFVLTQECERVSGTVAQWAGPSRIELARHSSEVGDVYVVEARDSKQFSLCLPPGTYAASVSGETLSVPVAVRVPSAGLVVLNGLPANVVRAPMARAGRIAHGMDDLIRDMERSGAQLIGLGEATHGSAEFVDTREQLTFELARRSRLRLVLFEGDAIAMHAIQVYVNGGGGDLATLISSLGFWITDTVEFTRFIEHIRQYNLAQVDGADRISVWGIDAQDTAPAIALLLENAEQLQIAADDRIQLALLSAKRGKAVMQFSQGQRARVDAVLSRLSHPAGTSEFDTLIAVAAQSLTVQLGYLEGDIGAMYSTRRDEGMARLARAIIERTKAPRACLWAHVDHIARHFDDEVSLGQRLATWLHGSYYPVGFYLFQGSSRAWDPAGKIGVISHNLGTAANYTGEGALLRAVDMPSVAWIPFSPLPSEWQRWLRVPRFVRELGAIYLDQEHVTLLINLRSALDALVIVKEVHDSTPTATGVRRVDSAAN